MRADEIIGDKVANTLVELGRAFQVGEEEGEAGDLQALIDVERVGAIDVSEGLIGEEALRREERSALSEQMMQLLVGDPDARQGAHVAAVFQLDAQRTR